MSEISIKQQRAALALLSQPTIAAAANTAQIAERTLYRWLADSEFRSYLSALEGQHIDATVRRLLSLQDAALSAIADLVGANVPASVRLRAATAVLDSLLRYRDLRNLESRLSALESRYGVQGETNE